MSGATYPALLSACEARRDALLERVTVLERALERIAGQGLGEYDPELRLMVGATGEPWEHWATIAQRALDA